jgi:hypothetical protein
LYWWWRERRAQQREDAMGYIPIRTDHFRQGRF